jgi:hypothetical protein
MSSKDTLARLPFLIIVGMWSIEIPQMKKKGGEEGVNHELD